MSPNTYLMGKEHKSTTLVMFELVLPSSHTQDSVVRGLNNGTLETITRNNKLIIVEAIDHNVVVANVLEETRVYHGGCSGVKYFNTADT